MKKYLMEGLGTFFLVLLLLLVLNNNTGTMVPLAYGAALIALTYAGGRFSAAHFNPALSLGALIIGKLERWEWPYYWIAQIFGGLLAAFFAAFLIRCGGTSDWGIRAAPPLCALFAEALGTFLLTFVYLSMTAAVAEEGRATASSLAVGFTAIACVFAFSTISNASFNPAILIAMVITEMISWNEIWANLLGQLIGAAAGASIFKALQGDAQTI